MLPECFFTQSTYFYQVYDDNRWWTSWYQTPPQSSLSFSNLEILLKEHAVYCSGNLIPMTQHEFAVLAYLARHPGWVFSASQIYEAVWNADGEHCGTAVASVIGQIRRKLTPDTPKGGYIRTVLGSGYKFNSSPF